MKETHYSITNKVLHDNRTVNEDGLKKVFGGSMYHVLSCITWNGSYEDKYHIVNIKE